MNNIIIIFFGRKTIRIKAVQMNLKLWS